MQAGFGTDAIGLCSLCPIGTYFPGVPEHRGHSASIMAAEVQVVQACLPCNALGTDGGFTTLTAGATDASQCVCKDG